MENLRGVAEAHRDPLAKAAHQLTSGAITHVRGRFGQALAEFDAAIEHNDALPGGGRQQVPTCRRRLPIRICRALALWLIGEQTRAARQRDELLLPTERAATPHDRAIALYACAAVSALGGDADTELCASQKGLEPPSSSGLGVGAGGGRGCGRWRRRPGGRGRRGRGSVW
ncbi:hypothetical protein [Streptomyces sp. NPDC007205]|uniref:hypothetical protein n=1 Tax=Streptomyces sp. NPDC007205 TaxID=3154316 RepID=UPI00340758C7